jgi:hypothetical protein
MSDSLLSSVYRVLEKVFSFAKTNFHAQLLCQIVTLKNLFIEVNKLKAHFKNTAFYMFRALSTKEQRTA